MTQPPHTMQLAGRAHWALMIAIHDALRRDLDQLLHATASHASARARWAAFRARSLGGLIAADRVRLRRRVAGGQTAGRGITGVRDGDPAVTSRV